MQRYHYPMAYSTGMKRCRGISALWIMVALAMVVISAAGCRILDPEGDGNLVPLTVMEDHTLPRFTTSDGTVLHLRTCGPEDPEDQTTVLVFHGGPGQDMRAYRETFSQLCDTYHVVFWDQRGAGLSQRISAGRITGEAYLQDVVDILEEHAPDQQVILLGHSWGGAYATYVTQQYPDKVRGLVLIEPMEMTREAFERDGGQETNLFSGGINRILAAADRTRPGSHAEADYLYQVVVAELARDEGSLPAVETTALRTGYVAWRATVEWLGFLSGTPYSGSGFDNDRGFLSGILENYAGRTLLIASDDDFLGIDLQRTYHAPLFNQEKIEILEIPGADHYLFLDPDHGPEVLTHIRTFLEDEL